MSDVGACLEVVSAVPSLQDLARRMYIMELTLAGEYSHLCLRFIQQCVHQASGALNALPEEMVTEVMLERSSLVVKVARWAAHNMLFWCGTRLSAPFIDWRLVGMHVEVMGDEVLWMSRGAYVTLESRTVLPDSLSDSDSSVELRCLATTHTVMLARGRVDQPIASRTRSCLAFGFEPVWIVQDGGGSEVLQVGWMEDADLEYDGLVGMIWDFDWKRQDDNDDFFDEDTNDRIFVYDVVFLGSTRVFDCEGWGQLYHHLS